MLNGEQVYDITPIDEVNTGHQDYTIIYLYPVM
jgi:hypothetical protein